jgi:hypothetical protein
VGAGALAWKHYSDELKEAEEWQRKQAEAAADAQRVHEALADAELDLSVMLGKVTAEEAAMTRGRARGMELVQPLIDKNTEAIERLRRESETLAGVGGVFFVQNRDAIERNQREINRLSDANQNLTGKGIALGVSLSGVTEKHKTATTAARAHKDVNDDLARTMADLQARVSAEDNPFAQVDAEVAALERLKTAYTLTAEQMAVVDERLAQLGANRADVEAASLEEQRRALEQMDEEIRSRQERMAEERQRQLEADQAQLEANNAAAIGGMSSLMSATSQLARLEADQAENSLKKRREMFALAKAAAIAEIAINTAVAISKALAQLGPLAGAAAAAGVTAAGAAQAAVVLSQDLPEAHMGEPASRRRFAPDEEVRVITKHEEVVTKREQREAAGGGGVVQVMLDGRVLDVLTSRSNRRTGQAMRAAKRVGHRARI